MANDAWVPEDYSVPTGGSPFMKFEDGDNVVRIMSKPTFGWELWIDNKPLRRKDKTEFTKEELAKADINSFSGERSRPQHFWALPVWNYAAKAIQLLQINQSSIQSQLLGLVRNPKWGALDKYDVNILKGKQGQQTKYTVQPEPPTALDAEIAEAWKSVTLHMDEYFTGGRPLEFNGEAVSADEIIGE